MFKTFTQHIDDNLPFLKQGKLLVAISGGVDSVVLTQLCVQLKLDVALAHCNFNLRGAESDADEAFVLELGERLDLEVFSQQFDTNTYAKANKLSVQMAARDLRYNWFLDLAKQLQFDYVLTAHHADDSVETMLINLSRGSSIEGLIGIPEINNTIVRPLLPFSREELMQFATAQNLKWREDSSNVSTKYLRNALRHEVIPKLKTLTPDFLNNVLKTQSYLREINADLQDRVLKFKNEVMVEVRDVNYLEIRKVKLFDRFYLYLFYALKDYGFTQWDDVYKLLDAQSGKMVFSPTHYLLKDRNFLILSKQNELENDVQILIDEQDNIVKLPSCILHFDTVLKITTTEKTIAYLDKDLLKFPLVVRPWKKGDYFYPFGMTGKKKLSKFFKDEKLSLLDKSRILILCSGDDIVWVIGFRIDSRFKVTEDTTKILKITVN